MTKTAKTSGKNSAAPTTDELPAQPLSEAEALHRVRDLLFGETARDHSRKVEDISEQMARELDDIREDYRAQVEELRRHVKREVDSLRWQLSDLSKGKVARQDLSAVLEALASELTEEPVANS